MHAWKYPEHERRLAELAREAGFTQVSASHAVSPLLRLVPRGDTTVVDAYLSPILRRYVDQVAAELDRRAALFHAVERRAGGCRRASRARTRSCPVRPAASSARRAPRRWRGSTSIIGFDMGGTSTDVALYAGGFERAFETAVAGVRMRAPMMAINTVAAGGGSILHFDGARLRVGPDSAGADPGPGLLPPRRPADGDRRQCLRRQDPAARISRRSSVRTATSRSMPMSCTTKFAALAEEIAQATGQPRTPQQVAEGFLQIAVANMANAIKQVSVQKGHDVTRFALQCFGGAGGQHACLVADALGMETVFIHPYRRRAVRLWHGPRRPDGRCANRRSKSRSRPHAHAGTGRRLPIGWPAERRRRWRRKAPTRRASTAQRNLHLRYAGTEAALIVPLRDLRDDRRRLHRGASRALRLRHAGSAAGGGGGRGRGDRAGRRGRRRPRCPRATAARREPIDRVAIFTGDAEHRSAGVRSHRSAGGRSHRRPGADPRGQRHHRGRTGLDRRDHRARSHDAAPHRAARDARAGRQRPARSGAARAVQQPVHERRRTDRRGAAEHLDERQHQGAAGFLLRHLRRRGLPGGERAARAGASRRDGRERAHRAEQPARHAEAGRRGRAEQSVQRRHASAGCHRHHAGVRRGRRKTSCSSSAAAAITPISAASRPARRRRCRARWKRKAS